MGSPYLLTSVNICNAAKEQKMMTFIAEIRSLQLRNGDVDCLLNRTMREPEEAMHMTLDRANR